MIETISGAVRQFKFRANLIGTLYCEIISGVEVDKNRAVAVFVEETLLLVAVVVFTGQCQADCISRENLAVEFVKERSKAVVGEKLIANERPVSNRTICPLFLQFDNAKVKQFENGIVVRKGSALRLVTLWKLELTASIALVLYMILRTADG